jgi:hypothetical protein
MGNVVRRLIWAMALLAGLLPALPANAAVTITFYSHRFHLFHGFTTEFPHGFVVLSGTTDTGQKIAGTELGFSATNFYARALLFPIEGALDDKLPDGYVSEALYHFSFQLTDAQYQMVMATADRWRNAPQPSYDFYTRNCVTFVRDIAVASGLTVSYSRKFIHDPKAFLDDAATRNDAFLTQHGITVPPVPDSTAGAPAPAQQFGIH